MIQESIESESQFVWKQIRFILFIPFLLFLILFGKRKFSELFEPLRELNHFIFEPKITASLVITNILVYLIEIFYLGEKGITALAFRPTDLLQGNVIPIIASWFLHASLAHLFGNMLVLYIFGRIIEKEFGAKILLIYFGSAIISDITSALFGQGGIGASGAIAGLISVSLLMKPFNVTYLIMGIPLPIMLVGWLSIISDISGVLAPQQDNIGHFAHLGGYIAASALVFLFNQEERKQMKSGLYINIGFVLIASIIYFYLKGIGKI